MSYVDTTKISDDAKVEVQNMSNGTLSYSLPSGAQRDFSGHMKMIVTAGELRELNTTSGGQAMIHQYLSVHNSELAKEFGIAEDLIQHEYSWTEEDIRRVLLSGSLDELLDALDYAPQGIVEDIANDAVRWKVSDNNKLKAISEATGLDIMQQIANVEAIEKKDKTNSEEKSGPRGRRAESSTTKQRRVKS